MNLSLARLALTRSIDASPMVMMTQQTQTYNLLLTNSLTERFTASFVHSNVPLALLMRKTVHKNHLGGVIVIESLVNQQIDEVNTTDMKISGCLFVNCTSINRSGGGILIISPEASVDLSNSCFINCRANGTSNMNIRTSAGGGAFAIHSYSLNCFNNVLMRCSTSTRRGCAIYASTFASFYINNTLLFQTFGDERSGCSFIYDLGYLYMRQMNSTACHLKDIGAAGSLGLNPFPMLADFRFSTFEMCSSYYLFHIYSVNDSLISHCAFTNNSACGTSLVNVEQGTTHITHTLFTRNINYTSTFTGSCVITFIASDEELIYLEETLTPQYLSTQPLVYVGPRNCRLLVTQMFTSPVFMHVHLIPIMGFMYLYA